MQRSITAWLILKSLTFFNNLHQLCVIWVYGINPPTTIPRSITMFHCMNNREVREPLCRRCYVLTAVRSLFMVWNVVRKVVSGVMAMLSP